jgi:hypothetical protein
MERKLKFVLEWMVARGWDVDPEGRMTNPKREVRKGSLTGGYLKVGVKIPELGISSYAVKIHKFQAYRKFGDTIFQEGVVVRHLNGDPQDNSSDNIVLGTQSQNMMDRDEQDRVKHSKERRRYSQEVKSRLIQERESGKSFTRISREQSIPLQSVKDMIRNSG